MIIKSDLNIINPGDKLILVTEMEDYNYAIELCNSIESFLASGHRVLIANNFDTYVIKRDAIILLRDKAGQMSQEMRMSLYGDRFNYG